MSSSFNPIVFALRHPITVMAAVALAVGAVLAVQRMAIDIFPTLDLPVSYIAQPYGGMSPGQMESQITSFYGGHSLYIGGIHHLESKNVQGMSLIKLYFHPGTNMAQAMAETIGYANRSKGYVPHGTVPPFIVRFDTGSVPVGYLVLESDDPGKYTMGQLQDLAIYRIRPIFGNLQGVSSPIGGNTRAVVVTSIANGCAPTACRWTTWCRRWTRATRSRRRATCASTTRCRWCRSRRRRRASCWCATWPTWRR